jgi:hypothetical protein
VTRGRRARRRSLLNAECQIELVWPRNRHQHHPSIVQPHQISTKTQNGSSRTIKTAEQLTSACSIDFGRLGIDHAGPGRQGTRRGHLARIGQVGLGRKLERCEPFQNSIWSRLTDDRYKEQRLLYWSRGWQVRSDSSPRSHSSR